MADAGNPTQYPANSPEAEAARRQAAEKALQARKEAQEAANKRLDEDDKAREASNLEVMERRNKGKPTPTQRESDLAKLGLLDIDSKEDDGSGPEVYLPNTRRSAMNAGQGNEPYKTREAKAK